VPLLGKTPHEKAIIDQWCEVESQNFNREVGTMFGEIFLATRVQNRPVNEALVAACLAKTGEIFDVYEKQLSKSTFIAGESYSLADLFHIPMLNRLMDTKRDIFTGRPHVLVWAENLIARPAYQKTVEAVTLLSSE
jgi:glutathione S-transferase